MGVPVLVEHSSIDLSSSGLSDDVSGCEFIELVRLSVNNVDIRKPYLFDFA
jgi:hypothetical protein